MKYTYSILFLLILVACATQKPVLYHYPAGMKHSKRAAFVADCEKGKVLYGIHCARCHNTMVDGKEVLPNFTPIQLEGYDLRMDEPKHKPTLTERNMPQEELDLIIKYLWYKKPNKTIQ